MENQLTIRCSRCGQATLTTNKALVFRCSRCSNQIFVQSAHEIQPRDSSGHGHGHGHGKKCIIGYKGGGGGRVRDFPSKPISPHAAVSAWGKGTPNKRALVCGVTYKNQKYKLKGTLNDAFDMRNFLVRRWGFSPTNIRMLTEEDGMGRGGSAAAVPTKRNMEEGMRWLVEGCKAGDSLVFYFSGHGVNLRESSRGDEIDGLDESLCPVDFTTSGVIRDDDINTTLVRPLPHGVTLHAIVDACHSGTVLDLPWVFNTKPRGDWVDNRPPSGTNKDTSGGRAISFSACRDDQMAADTSAFTNKGMNGALTMSLIQALNNNQDLSYYKLLVTMQDTISKSRGSKFRIMLDKFLRRYFVQDPLLSSSEIFDVYNTKFQL